MKIACRLLALSLCLLIQGVLADSPKVLSHQGRIAVDGVNFDGTGEFRFLLFESQDPNVGGTALWNNETTTPSDLNTPSTSISAAITKGLYSVSLGDSPMAALPASLVPSTNHELYLRIWFDDGVHGTQLLSPDRRLDAVPFALNSNKAAAVADGAITANMLAPSLSIPNVQAGVFQTARIASSPYSVTFPTPFGSPPVVTSQPNFPFPSSQETTLSNGFIGTIDIPPTLGTGLVDEGASGTRQGSSIAEVDGRPAIAYIGANVLKFAINANADGSGAWTISSVDTTISMLHCSLAVIGGKPAISYRQNLSGGNLKFAINSAVDGSGSWNLYFADSGAGDQGFFSSLAEVDGRPAIAHTFFSSGGASGTKFSINASADGSGAWTSTFIGAFQPESGNGWFPDLSVVDGNPAICYRTGDSGTGLEFSRNTAADGTGTWTNTTVDASPGDGCAMAIVDGKPAISYRATDSTLKFAINANTDGSGAWTTTPIPASGGLIIGTSNGFTSLAQLEGVPTIAYYSDGSFDFKIAYNDSPDGSGTWTIRTVDSEGTVGGFPSIGIANGQPMASYFDSSNQDLKIWIPPSIDVSWIAVGQ